MEIYRIAFIGHREIYGHYLLEDQIEQIARDKLYEKEYVEFYVGRNGDFDISVAAAIKRAQNAVGHHNSCLILLQPYPMKDDEYYEKFYDEVQYPVDSKTHPKAAIMKRNQWMIDNADLLVAYVEEDRSGGAMTTLKYAKSKGVKARRPPTADSSRCHSCSTHAQGGGLPGTGGSPCGGYYRSWLCSFLRCGSLRRKIWSILPLTVCKRRYSSRFAR